MSAGVTLPRASWWRRSLHESGSLDDETFRAYRDYAAALLSTPGGGAFWSHARITYPSHVVALLQQRIDEGNLLHLPSDPAFEA